MPFVYEQQSIKALYFDMSSVQSAMDMEKPEKLVIGYTRTMMGFLLFNPSPKTIAMIGLGGGSLAKYCRKHLPEAAFTAIEVNDRVIALRDEFGIPCDDPCFQVVRANGADYVARRTEQVDVLLVDGFAKDGHPYELTTAGFYDNCYAKLNEGGVMVANLLGTDVKIGTYVSRIRDSFEDRVVMINAEEDGNKIVFAFKGQAFPLDTDLVMSRAFELGPQHPVKLHDTALRIMQRMNKRTSTIEL